MYVCSYRISLYKRDSLLFSKVLGRSKNLTVSFHEIVINVHLSRNKFVYISGPIKGNLYMCIYAHIVSVCINVISLLFSRMLGKSKNLGVCFY